MFNRLVPRNGVTNSLSEMNTTPEYAITSISICEKNSFVVFSYFALLLINYELFY